MTTAELYREHVAKLSTAVADALSATGFDALVVQAGTPFRYFADDMDAPFHPTPHFAHWTPLAGPHHLLRVAPGERPRLARVAPEDYWYEQAPLGDPFWAGEYEIVEVPTVEEAWRALAASLSGRWAYVGDAPEAARAHGAADDARNPSALVARLDWNRSYKTAYEIACLEGAAVAAARGHHAARAAFEDGASELAIHQAYVAAVGCVDQDLPYETIIGLDEKGAILHYVGKRAAVSGAVLLIDAGARHLGYCSDVTRTWTRAGAPAAFADLATGMDRLQQELCRAIRPGLAYGDLHERAHVAIGDLLHATGILAVGGEDALAEGLTAPFFPHGLGHFLGIQVHDVAGHQREPAGGRQEPPARFPFLRTTRTIEPDQVFTIEPGLYFIEMLLREHRTGPTRDRFDWALIDALAPYGGVRVEDDVVVTGDGHRNLTRPHLEDA